MIHQTKIQTACAGSGDTSKKYKNFQKDAPVGTAALLLYMKALEKPKRFQDDSSIMLRCCSEELKSGNLKRRCKAMDMEKLAENLKKGDESALEAVIDRFTPLVSTIIFNLANGSISTTDIEELTSDTFVALWYNRDKIQPDKLKGYLCCIAKNKAKNRLKSLGRHQTIDIDEVDYEDGFMVSEEIENKMLTEALRQALDEIGEPDREIIIRHYYYYQSSTDISEQMGMNSETVKSRIKRARAKLKTILAERGYTR